MSNYPFKETILSESLSLRKFSSNINQNDLIWHRDAENRIIEVLSGTGWQFQRDNKLPIGLNEGDRVSVSAGEYHRVIKGNSDLYVKIYKEGKKKKLSKKQMKIAKAAPPPDKITGADFEALRDKKNTVDEKRRKRRKVRKKATAGEKKYRREKYGATTKKRQSGFARAAYQYRLGNVKKAAAIRKRMEEPHMAENTLDKDTLAEMIDEIIEYEKLRNVLENFDVEDFLLEGTVDEKRRRKRRRKRKKRNSAGGLSAKVKKSLDKKADRRCLTRGSVYAEFRAGLAAYLSSGSRKGMSAHQWAHARVNSANPSKSWAKVKKRKKCPKKKRSKK
jgi:hypothetical protein